MEKELVELFEAAKNAADAAAMDDGSVDETRCLDALQRLKDFPVNYQILVTTQVGKRLRHLAKHPRKKIQSFATELIEIWKNIIMEESKNKKTGNLENKNSVEVEPSNMESNKKKANSVKVEKANSVEVENVPRAETVKKEKIEEGISSRPEKREGTETVMVERKLDRVISPRPEKISRTETVTVERKLGNTGSAEAVKVERITKQEKEAYSVKRPSAVSNAPPKLSSMIKCNDSNRDRLRELLFEALSKVSSEADESIREEVDVCDPIRVAISVESTMFENWGSSIGSNKLKYRSVVFNLKDQKNPDFRRKMLLGQIEPERIVSLTPEEMASDQRRAENQQIKEKALFECERGGPAKATTDQFRCGRCKQRKCTYYQLQTRSADEPMTTFVTCVNCNNHWKFC